VVRLRATTGVAGLALLAALVPAWLAPAQTSTIPFEEDDRLATRYGPVIPAKAEAASPPRWRVTFDGRTLLETEFDELGLWEVFEGATTATRSSSAAARAASRVPTSSA
jgi:hypothetical protein